METLTLFFKNLYWAWQEWRAQPSETFISSEWLAHLKVKR